MLATLLRPDAGEARISAHKVARDGAAVRSLIGVTGQYASVDETLSATENLVVFGRLLGLSARAARVKSAELLEEFSLTDAAKRSLRNSSGGMRRRLDLAASLIARPPLIFLDEADQLADRIAVIDQGRVVAEGTADELKATVGAQSLQVGLAEPDGLGTALGLVQQVLGTAGTVAPEPDLAGPIGASLEVAASAHRDPHLAVFELVLESRRRPALTPALARAIVAGVLATTVLDEAGRDDEGAVG